MKYSILCILFLLISITSSALNSNLYFATYSYSFGTIHEYGGDVYCDILVYNNGTKPVKITKVITSVGCVSATYPQNAIPPKSQDKVTIVCSPFNEYVRRAGAFKSTPTFETDEKLLIKIDISGYIKADSYTSNGNRRTVSSSFQNLNPQMQASYVQASTSVYKSGYCGQSVEWEYNPNNNSLTIKGSGTMRNYTTSSLAPWSKLPIKEVTIEQGVLSIGNYAFYKQSSLKSIHLPISLTNIGEHAFEYCNLENVIIPANVTSLGMYAFGNCTNLQTVVIPQNVTNANAYAFLNCRSLNTIICSPQSKKNYTKWASSINKKIKVKASSNPLDFVEHEVDFATLHSKTPPAINFVPGTLQFVDANNNRAIDAQENSYISFNISNDGKGVGYGCKARITAKGATNGLSYKDIALSPIEVGSNSTIKIPISSYQNTTNGSVSFMVWVEEPNGFGMDPIELEVETRAFNAPYIKIVDYSVTANGGSVLLKKQPFNLQLMLQNIKYGAAEDVHVSVSLPTDVFMLEGKEQRSFTTLNAGECKSLEYQLVVNNNYSSTTIPVKIHLSEKYGNYSEDRTINLQLNQALASTKLSVEALQQEQRDEIQIAHIGSTVDRNIPVTSNKNTKTFVLIIANEQYRNVSSVPFALNDGNIFREYCIKTLGISDKHIKYVPNATINDIRTNINWLNNLSEAFDEPNIILYYAGHGIPDESSKSAYLLPVDGSGSDVTTAYKLDDLYATLGAMPAAHITVFMDACFSGSKRENGMLASARGIALKAKSGVPQGNMVVFSAAQGDETAYPNREEGHGMFTYYLLKKLQETKGDVSLLELGDYITTNVRQQSIVLNGKSQTPTISASTTLGDSWKNWKLK